MPQRPTHDDFEFASLQLERTELNLLLELLEKLKRGEAVQFGPGQRPPQAGSHQGRPDRHPPLDDATCQPERVQQFQGGRVNTDGAGVGVGTWPLLQHQEAQAPDGQTAPQEQADRSAADHHGVEVHMSIASRHGGAVTPGAAAS